MIKADQLDRAAMRCLNELSDACRDARAGKFQDAFACLQELERQTRLFRAELLELRASRTPRRKPDER